MIERFSKRDLAMNRVSMGMFLGASLACPLFCLPWAEAAAGEGPKDRVVVMYFHRTERCPTCLKMGSYADEAVTKGFAEEIKAGKVSFHFIDFQAEENQKFTQGYHIEGPSLLVAQVSGGKVKRYKRLDEMWTKVRDKQEFLEYVQGEVRKYLKQAEGDPK